MFWWQDHLEAGGRRIDRAFTDTRDGVSAGAAAGLNLGGGVGDRPEDVETNRRRLADALAVPRDHLVLMQQVHGTDVVVVERAGQPIPPCDGVVTSAPGLALVVLVADCTPVLLADPDTGMVAAVHAGRPGMISGVVGRAVDVMRGLGARHLAAAVGPSVCGRCYEVPEAMREEAAVASAASRAMTRHGTPAIDVAAGVVEQLARREVDVTWVDGCTRESPRLYSYRRDHATGRQGGVIVARRGTGR